MSNINKVIVCGGRNYGYKILGTQRVVDNEALRVFAHTMQIARDKLGGTMWIVSGGASGADELAEKYAESTGIVCTVVNADWKQHGKAAGPIRNQQMLDDHQPKLVVAFPGGRGTADMVRRARNAGVEVMEV